MDEQAEYIRRIKDQFWAHILNPFVLLGHITWCQKFFWWRSFLWSFHGICRFASFYCCLNSNVIQDSCRFKATDLPHPYLCVFFFFQDNFYQKKSVRSALQKSKRICYPVSRKLSRGIIGYLGPLIQRVDSLEKAQMLGKIEGKRRNGWQRIRWLDGITDWIWANFGRQWRTGKPDVLQSTDTT